jgi:hypothetical protein
LTQAEADDLSSVDSKKLRQAFARSTNELMSSYQIPLRRAKQEDNEKFEASQDAQAEDEAREAAAKERRLA